MKIFWENALTVEEVRGGVGKEGNQLAKTYPEKSVLLHALSTYTRACVRGSNFFGKGQRKICSLLLFHFHKKKCREMAEEKCCSSSAVPFQLVEKITGRPSRKPKFGRSQKPEEKKRRRTNIHLVRRLHGAFDFIFYFFYCVPPHAAAFVAPNGRRVEKFSSLSSEKMANNYRPIMFFRKGRRGARFPVPSISQ